MKGKKAVIFGAGNIGRGFLGLELYHNNYELTFVENNQDFIDFLNQRQGYEVEIAETSVREFVPIKRAVSVYDSRAINREVLGATIVATAVGPEHLSEVGKCLLQPITSRTERENFLNVIACENMVNNSRELRKYIFSTLTRRERDKIATFIGFPSSVVDRISIPSRNLTSVEKNFEWIAQGDYWKAFSPPDCIEFVAELDPFLRRKLYVLNGAHATIGYLGKEYLINHVHEAIRHSKIREVVIGNMKEASAGLANKYEFELEELATYQKSVLKRFENPAIMDPVFRLVRGQARKLGREERLVGPALLAIEAGIAPTNITKGIVALLSYYDETDIDSIELHRHIQSKGLRHTLKKYADLRLENRLDRELIEIIEKEAKK